MLNASNWRRSGERFDIEWGGRAWSLDPTADRPGLRSADASSPRLLELCGLAATHRRSDSAFEPTALVGVELLHARVVATYAPGGWHGLTVRAAWGPSPDGDGLDLEVQASTTTVGELRRVEVLVQSTWLDGTLHPTQVEPRDRISAMLTYDGREPAELLHRATTAPVPAAGASAFEPLTSPASSTDGWPAYVEMVHPHDVSRRLFALDVRSDGQPMIASIRYALFGHDLEKGVVVRGRLRGVWIAEGEDDEAHRRRFLEGPPPLGS